MPRYTKKDVGCWIDSAYGIDHACKKLACMIGESAWTLSLNEVSLINRLENCLLSDDHCELDEATDLLQNITEDGLQWTWDGGNLILTDEDI